MLYEVRRLEKNLTTQVRYKLHLCYLHQSKENGILPRFLLSQPPINNPKAWNIAHKTGWKHLRVLISECHRKLEIIQQDQDTLKSKVKTGILESRYERLNLVLAQRCEHLRTEVERRHQRKLKRTSTWGDKDIKRRWVVNISERELKENEISLLRKGFNFAITPWQTPTKEILASVEPAIHHLPRERPRCHQKRSLQRSKAIQASKRAESYKRRTRSLKRT